MATYQPLHEFEKPPRNTDFVYNLLKLALSFLIGATLSLSLQLALRQTPPTDRDCSQQISVWSPLSEAIEFESKDFVNYFSHPSPYRGPPTPELEREWNDLLVLDPIGITKDRLKYLNRSVEDSWVMTSKPGHEGEYIATFEVFHQLHCLNIVRQYTWLDHYKERPYDLSGTPVSNRMHVDHCLETLRLSLMCNADVTPLLTRVNSSRLVAEQPDFNTFHKCKRWDPLVSWIKDHTWT